MKPKNTFANLEMKPAECDLTIYVIAVYIKSMVYYSAYHS